MLTGAAPFKMKYKRRRRAASCDADADQPGAAAGAAVLHQQAFELTGVSQASATSSKSSLGPGASGVALDTQYDIESERFAMVEAQYARYRMDAAQLYLDAARRVAKRREADKGKKKLRRRLEKPRRDRAPRVRQGRARRTSSIRCASSR
jgi:hypothetical protein